MRRSRQSIEPGDNQYAALREQRHQFGQSLRSERAPLIFS
jgi:hypothetical protein